MKGFQAVRPGTIEHRQVITESLFFRFVAFLDASPKTVDTYKRALRPLFKYFAENGITQPEREDVLAYRDGLKATYRPATVQTYITAARLFFKWTAQENLYPNIAAHIKGAKLDREHKKGYLTSAQAKRMIASIGRDTQQGKRDYAILSLMLTGGLRTIEVTRANLEDLRNVGDSTVLYIQGKGREEKTEYVKITPPVERAIRAYLHTRGPLDPGAPIFASSSNNSKGKRLTTRTVSGMVKERMKAAGYDDSRLTAHSLRHTAVTLSLLCGNTLQEVQQFARHSNITTTQIYAHNLDRAKNRCEESISESLF